MRVSRKDAGIAVGVLSCLVLSFGIQAVARVMSVAGWFVAGEKQGLMRSEGRQITQRVILFCPW